jgi:hypothetical protein
MYALRWKETKPGRFEAEMDGRWARILRHSDGTWHWMVTYPGETECRRGVAKAQRAAEQACARNL